MSNERFGFGDRVRHVRRPEWGIGSVVKCEDVTLNGTPTQRLSVRFPGLGVKTLSTAHADLQRVAALEARAPEEGEDKRVELWEQLGKSDWLAGVAQRKINEAMTSLSEEVRDPFNSLRQRLITTLGLYRFERTGRGLMDWAVAQSGLEDPLSRFNRHELEEYYDRWTVERDAQLDRLLQEAAGDQHLIDEALTTAPPAARKAVRRRASVR